MTNATTDQKVTRRSVVRIGANAAWAVPAIAIVGAAPAIACSTTSTGFNVTSLAVARGTGNTTAQKGVTGTLSVKNDKQVGALTPSITVVVTGGTLNAVPTITGYGAGTGAITSTGGTFTYTALAPVLACTSLVSNISYSYKTTSSGGSVKVTVSPGNNVGPTSITDAAL